MKLFKIVLICFLVLCSSQLVGAQIVNPTFNSNLDGWDSAGNLTIGRAASSSYDGSDYAQIWVDYISTPTTLTTFSQTVDVTGYYKLTLVSKVGIYQSADRGGYTRMYIGGNYVDLNEGWENRISWFEQEVDISGTGDQTVKLEVYTWYQDPESSAGVLCNIDNVYLTATPVLSGYIKGPYGDPIIGATIAVNFSDLSTTSNETGYYSLLIPPQTVSYSVTRSGYNDYTDTVVITGDATKNVSLSYATPTLTSLSILDSGDNSLLLGWKESLGADGVYVYVDSQTNLVATVETPYTNIKMYDLTNLDPGTSYNIWCKPYKDSLEGSMYYVSGTTTGGGGGGGGGGAVEVLPPYEDIQPETPEYPETYDMTNITSGDLITLAATNPEVIYEALSNITIKSPLPDKPGDNLLYFYLLIISVCSTLFSSKKEGWEVVTIISFVAVVISLIKLGWI